MIRSRSWLYVAVGVTTILASCVGDDPAGGPSPTEDGGVTDAGSAPSLGILSIEPLSAAPGRVTKSKIVIERRNGLTGPVRVTASALPAGVDVPAFDILDGETSAEISTTATVVAVPARTSIPIEVTGTGTTARSDVPLVVRGVPGSLDRTRSPSGLHILGVPPNASAQDGSGRIWVLGNRGNNCALARHLPTGEVDATFGSGGSKALSFSNATGCHGIAVQGDKVLVSATEYVTTEASGSSSAVLVRVTSDGSPDPTFGTNGAYRLPSMNAGPIGVDAQGRISFGVASGQEPVVARLDANGAQVSLSVALEINPNDDIGWAFGADGAVRVAFELYDGEDKSLGVAGFDVNGAVEANLGLKGVFAPTIFGTTLYRVPGAITIDRQKRAILAGTGRDAQGNQTAYLARYNDDKGNPWRFALPYVSAGKANEYHALAALPDSSILAVGQRVASPAPPELLLARITEGLVLDQTFAPGGVIVYPEIANRVAEILPQPDGAALVLQSAGNEGLVVRIWL